MRAAFVVVPLAVLLGGAASSARAVTFTNAAPIAINDATGPSPGTPSAATPYPAPIAVAGVVGTVTKVSATLHGFHHTCAQDVDLLLVGPRGQESVLMSDAGDCDVGTQQPAPVELAFDDTASVGVPCLNGPSALLQSGDYVTTNDPTAPGDCTHDNTAPDVFAPPAPAGPYPLGLAAFNGVDPNGSWSLYAMDQFSDDSGAIDGGWSLDLTVAAGTLGSPPQIKGAAEVGKTLTATSGTLGGGAAAGYQWNRCSARGSGCTPINGATKGTYKLRRADRGHTLTVTETALSSGGNSAPQASRHTGVVGPALLSLAGTKRSQRALARGRLRVTLRSNLSGTLRVAGKVGRAKLRAVHRRLRAGRRVTFTLRLTPAARRAIAGAAKPRARLTLVVVDRSRAKSTTRLTVRLTG